MWVYTNHSACVEVRGKLLGVSSFLSLLDPGAKPRQCKGAIFHLWSRPASPQLTHIRIFPDSNHKDVSYFNEPCDVLV